MPTITRWFIRSALVYFVASLALGVALGAGPFLDAGSMIAALVPVYFHLFMVGWVTQMIFGVAHWMFPRASREQPRGREGLALGTLAALNGGLLLRAVAEPLVALDPRPAWSGLLVVSAALQWLAAVAFTVNIWPRVKER